MEGLFNQMLTEVSPAISTIISSIKIETSYLNFITKHIIRNINMTPSTCKYIIHTTQVCGHILMLPSKKEWRPKSKK